MNNTAKKYLNLVNPIELLKTKKVLQVNPTIESTRDGLKASIIDLHTYNENKVNFINPIDLNNINKSIISDGNNWLNIDIVNKDVVEKVASIFKIHPLIVEDILSENQRPKIDEIDDKIYIVLHMMYYNEIEHSIESEQLSFVLGKNFLITFQDDESRDHFDTIRAKLQMIGSKCRNYSIDYLFYCLLDSIIDNYYTVIDKLGQSIESLEETISKNQGDNYTMNRINSLRKEMILFRRNVVPARDLIDSLIETDNPLINKQSIRYFKDVHDHITQAVDLSDNYKDVVTNIRDLYINQVNLRSNEVMKVLTIITSLLAPATVIGGIFGMNFDVIPAAHKTYGFWLAVGLMCIIPVFMLWWFRSKKWF